MERLRAGVIGVGAIAQIMHLPYLRELDDRFQIAALCDVDPVVLAEVGRQYGVDRLFASADELLDEPLDVVLILSSGDHGPVTIAALERGLHVLVEKPLAYTLRETDDVIAAAERAGKTLMVGMMKQYDPGYQRGVELVQRLRDLRYVEATTLEPEGTLYHAHHPIVRSGEPRQAQEERYGAEMFNGIQQDILASQPRDLLREATGSDDPGCADLLLPAPRQLDPRRQRPARRDRTAGQRSLRQPLGGRDELHDYPRLRERRARPSTPGPCFLMSKTMGRPSVSTPPTGAC